MADEYRYLFYFFKLSCVNLCFLKPRVEINSRMMGTYAYKVPHHLMPGTELNLSRDFLNEDRESYFN